MPNRTMSFALVTERDRLVVDCACGDGKTRIVASHPILFGIVYVRERAEVIQSRSHLENEIEVPLPTEIEAHINIARTAIGCERPDARYMLSIESNAMPFREPSQWKWKEIAFAPDTINMVMVPFWG